MYILTYIVIQLNSIFTCSNVISCKYSNELFELQKLETTETRNSKLEIIRVSALGIAQFTAIQTQ